MAEAAVDAFLLYNEREQAVETIDHGLRNLGLTTHYWRRDIAYGNPVDEAENQRLTAARVVLVLLGDEDWGPNHLRLTQEARSLGKRIIPVLIGNPPGGAFLQAGGLFREFRYVDARKLDEDSFKTIAAAVRAPNENGTGRDDATDPLDATGRADATGRFDAIIRVLTDGNEEERARLVERISVSDTINRAGLAGRLRLEIEERFSPGTESRFASAIRDPKKISSVRSWMLSALIGADAEAVLSRELILKHVQTLFEPDRNVRFWVLAGLYNRNVSYLADALEVPLSDPETEVAGLARAIARPNDDRVINDLRRMLHDVEFTTAWAALRILRVVPLPALAPDVCAIADATLTGTSIAYDAFYALSSPPMAVAAAPLLIDRFGLDGLVTRIIAEARVASQNTVHDFALLLSAFDPVAMDRALTDAARDPETGDTARALRGAVAQQPRSHSGNALYVAGYTSDTINVKHEFLGIDEDVQTLTAVMLAAQVKPPLAIGLFGDWGSGKSYFMKSMNVAAAALAARAKRASSPQFCHDIVQIEFNAWHYADTNLWTNLVSTILEQLAKYVTPRPTPEEEQDALLKELGTAKVSIAEANAVKTETERSIANHQADLVKLQRERQNKEVTLRDLQLSDFKKLLTANGKVKSELVDALKEAGVPALLGSAADLSHAVTEAYSLRGRTTALFVAFTKGKNVALLLILVAVLLLIPIGVPYLIGRFNGVIANIATAVSEAVVGIGGLAALIGTASGHVSKVLKRIESAKEHVDELIAQKRRHQDPAETNLQEEILKLKAQEQEAAARVVAASSRVTELEDRIRAMKEARSLARFLSERTSSDDYRKYLGLISTVRRDFEALSKRLSDARADDTDVHGVDRIVLYIDDLDRCPAPKVMEVLQAVHLLLAYELFVVVVGVDPRWLLHSLESTLTAFQQVGDAKTPSADLWVTTPRDYLEKIFQIPFAVLPMNEGGYSRLMGRLLSSYGETDGDGAGTGASIGASGADAGRAAVAATTATSPPGGTAGVSTGTNRGTAHDAGIAGSEANTAAGSSPSQPAAEFVIHEEALTIKPWEEAYAQRLFPFIPTPRAAKRFSNVYRILKAPVRREDLTSFEGTAEVPGEFRVAMLALAILIGAPGEAAELFPKLYAVAAAGGDMMGALRNIASLGLEEPEFAVLQAKLDAAVDDGFASADSFTNWLPRVSRFSFDVGRGVTHGAHYTRTDQLPVKSST